MQRFFCDIQGKLILVAMQINQSKNKLTNKHLVNHCHSHCIAICLNTNKKNFIEDVVVELNIDYDYLSFIIPYVYLKIIQSFLTWERESNILPK